MSITTTGFYGLDRDFLAMIPPGCNAFNAHKVRNFAELDPLAKADAARKQAQREAWHKQKLRAKAKRVNPHSAICEPSGFAKQKAEIRKEMRRAA